MTDRMKNTTPRAALAAAAALPVLIAGSAFGQARIWDGGTDADANWSTPNNWNVDTAPPLTPVPGEGWRFGSSATELVTNMDNPYSFGQLQFIGVSGYVVNSSTGSTMSLAGFNNGQAIVNAPGNASTVNVPVTFNTLNANPGNATEVNRRTLNTDSGSLTLGNTLNAGGFVVRKLGSGSLTLGAANAITGGVEINNGTVLLGNDAGLGTAPVSNPSGNNVQILSSNGVARTIANPINFSGQGSIGFSADNGVGATLTGPITAGTLGGAAAVFGVGANTTVTVNGVISGAGGVTKGAGGTLVLNANNTYAGGTFVSNGRLAVNGTSTSDTTVGGGTLQGTGQARILSVFDDPANANPAGTLSPADDTAAGTFTAGRADFGSGGMFLVDLNDVNGAAGTGFDQLLLNGNGGTPNSNLSVSADAATPFTVALDGTGAGFDPAQMYSFLIVAAGDVTGATPTDAFDPATILVDASAFDPSFAGAFSVAETGGGLSLVYTPGTVVPEPTALAAIGFGGLALLRRRRA